MQSTLLEASLNHGDSEPIPSQVSIKSLNSLPFLSGIEALLDLCTGCVSFALAFRLTRSFSLHSFGTPDHHMVAAGLIFSCMVVLLLDRSGAYRSSGGLLRVRETASVLEASLLTFLIVAASVLLFGDKGSVPFVTVAVCLLTASLLLQKQLLHFAIDVLRQRGYGLRRVLIYGSGSSANMLFSALARSPKLGLQPVAIVSDGGAQESTPVYESGYRRRRSLVSLSASFHASLIRAYHADVVIVATRPASEQALRNVLDESAKAGATVAFAADVATIDSPLIDYIELDGQLLYGMHKLGPRYFHQFVSRAMDVLVSATLLVLVSPLFALIGLLIKLDSHGPVLFRQQRVGKDGHSFTIYKFRSMYAQECGDGLSPESSLDPRITRMGRWLRKTSIDEIPQLLNILKGEMALVGPRPEMAFVVANYSETHRQRLSVKPGLTGLWQISADRGRPIHENIQYDLYYIKNRSVFMDIAVLFHTVIFAMNGI
ncbi:MAG TPA: sugar transferase [Acidisarcina sp.]